jgi:pyruvate kinase
MSLPAHKTKIIATIGPASCGPETLQAMLRAGMNVARLNFSHGDFSVHLKNIRALRAAAAAVGTGLAIMADLPGPKMRIGMLAEEKIILKHGERFTLTTDTITGDQTRVSVSFPALPQVVKPGDRLSLNDGYVQLTVDEVSGSDVHCTVITGGELRSKKGLNLPAIDLGISAFTERDRECLRFALENGVDAVSQSFVESAADIRAVRDAAYAMGGTPFIIAKIERSRALERLDEILDSADGIMIARGDLGVEIPIERIAVVQKDIMRRARRRGRPVITATQMLESMITYSLPTRAEATDVSNAILDGTDCVMLSGESAIGAYPVESVAMLARIAASVEPERRSVSIASMYAGMDLTKIVQSQHLISISVEATMQYLKPAAVFARTDSGVSARRLASMRLPAWIIAVSPSSKTTRDLHFSSGIIPVYLPEAPASWNEWVRKQVKEHGLSGAFAILTQRPSPADPESNHRMEVVTL